VAGAGGSPVQGPEVRQASEQQPRGKTEPLEQEVDLRELTGVEPDASQFWQRVAPVANGFLDVSCWGPPPWSADRWVTLCHVLEMAVETVQEETSRDVSGHPKDPVTPGI
jgi:hypothetical protein